MAAEGALLVSPNLGSCAIDSTFTAQVEHRNVKEVRKFDKLLHTVCFTQGVWLTFSTSHYFVTANHAVKL
jgi:hypothetical protein